MEKNNVAFSNTYHTFTIPLISYIPSQNPDEIAKLREEILKLTCKIDTLQIKIEELETKLDLR